MDPFHVVDESTNAVVPDPTVVGSKKDFSVDDVSVILSSSKEVRVGGPVYPPPSGGRLSTLASMVGCGDTVGEAGIRNTVVGKGVFGGSVVGSELGAGDGLAVKGAGVEVSW